MHMYNVMSVVDNGYMLMFVFFFKQKTAYEMRISDWSSDVCSSDLWSVEWCDKTHPGSDVEASTITTWMRLIAPLDRPITVEVCIGGRQIGRASCRERVCQYV